MRTIIVILSILATLQASSKDSLENMTSCFRNLSENLIVYYEALSIDEGKRQTGVITEITKDNINLFAGKEYNPYFHPPYAASRLTTKSLYIEKIEDNKVWGYYFIFNYTKAFVLDLSCSFEGIALSEDACFTITPTWGGSTENALDDQAENLPLPEAKTTLHVKLDRIIDGNPIITTQEGYIDEYKEILQSEYPRYANIYEETTDWFSNEYMHYDLGMDQEEMAEWLKEYTNNPWL